MSMNLETRRKRAKRSPEVALLARVAAGEPAVGDLDHLRAMVAALRDGQAADGVFGIARKGAGAPPRHYQRDQNVMRVVRVLELMKTGLIKEVALPQAAMETGVAESTLEDLYKKYWRDAAAFLKYEADYADEDAPEDDTETDGPNPTGEEFKNAP